MTKIRVFGDSHVACLREGAAASELVAASGLEVEFYGRHGLNYLQFEVTDVDGKVRIFSHALPQRRPLDYVIDSPEDIYFFSSILHSARSFSNVAWRTFCPWQCAEANPALQPVSSAVLRTWIEDQVRSRYDLLVKLKAHGYRVAVVEPPKPLPRASRQLQIRPDVLRAVDDCHRSVVGEMLRAADIDVISVPEHTHADGFTTDEYMSTTPRDIHHGNERFGAEMMDSIVRYALLSSPVVEA
jgi:hypothetical protein